MKKDLIKLASDLDKMGYVKAANRVDSLLLKIAELYDNHANWGDQKRWYLVNESSIVQDFYDIKGRTGNQEALDAYIRDEKIADWQKEKVVKAITGDSRWSSDSSGSVGSDRHVTKGELEKLVMHSMDPSNTYKMSDDMYEKIKHFIFGDGNLSKDSPSNDVMLSDLNEVERAAIV